MEKFCMVGPFIEIPHISGLHEIKRKQGVHSKKIYKGIDLKFKFHPYTGEELQTVVTSTQKIFRSVNLYEIFGEELYGYFENAFFKAPNVNIPKSDFYFLDYKNVKNLISLEEVNPPKEIETFKLNTQQYLNLLDDNNIVFME